MNSLEKLEKMKGKLGVTENDSDKTVDNAEISTVPLDEEKLTEDKLKKLLYKEFDVLEQRLYLGLIKEMDRKKESIIKKIYYTEKDIKRIEEKLDKLLSMANSVAVDEAKEREKKELLQRLKELEGEV